MTTASIGIRIGLEGAQRAQQDLRSVGRAVEDLGSTADSIRGTLSGLAGAFAGIVSVQSFVRAADAVTVLQNQLKLATGSAQSAAQAYNALFDIAQRSRVSFTELGGTFATITRATESLGLSQQQLLTVTQAIGNAVAISGSSAASAQAALVQLGQGLAAGALRGEELNSILEQTPRLARALADGLGVSVGQLRSLGEQGLLTAETVISALQSQSQALSREVETSVVTVGQAFTQLSNSAVKAAGDLDDATGASKALVTVLQGLSTALGTVGAAARDNAILVQAAVGAVGGAVALAALAKAAAAVKALAAAWVGLGAAIAANPIGAVVVGITAVGAAGTLALREWQKTESGIKNSIQGLEQQIANSERALERARARGAEVPAQQIEQRISIARQEIAKLTGELAVLQAATIDTSVEDARLAADNQTAGAKLREAQQKAEQERLEAEAAAAVAKKLAEENRKKAIEDFQKSASNGLELFRRFTSEASGLSEGFAQQWQDLSNAFKAGKFGVEELTVAQAALLAQQPIAKQLAEEQAAAERAKAEAVVASTRAYFEQLAAFEASADSAEKQLTQLLDEERALMLAAERNISLAQAVEELGIARLRERQAALLREGDRDSEVLAIQREIDARKQLAAAIGRSENRQLAERTAQEAAREWQRTAENIERSLTDALLRGFESGKDFAENLRDTVANMFRTLVLRPVIQAAVNPVANTITNALGIGQQQGSGGGSSLLSTASTIKDIFSLASGSFVTSLASTIGTVGSAFGSAAVSSFASGLASTAPGFIGPSLAGAGGAAGAGASVGAFLTNPWTVGIGLGLAGLSLLGGGGETRSGSTYRFTNEMGVVRTQGPSGGEIAGQEVRAAIDATARGINGLFAQLGSEARLDEFWGGLESSGKGRGFVFAGGTLNTGATFGEFLGREGVERARGGTLTAQEAVQELSLDLKQATLQALQAATDIPTTIRDAVAGINTEALGEDAATALLNQVGSVIQAVDGFRNAVKSLPFENLKNLSFDAAANLIQLAGGIDQFSAALSTYYENFFSEQERLESAAARLKESFAGLNLAVPSSREAFRALVEAQDLSTEAGRRTYNSLIQLSGAFSQVTESAAQAAAQAEETARRQAAQAVDQARGAAQAALQAIERSVAAERDQLQRRFEVESGVLRDRIGAISQVVGTLDGAISSVRGSINQVTIESQTAARLTLQSILNAVQGGTSVRDFAPAIEQASQTVSQAAPNLFATRADFVRAQAQSASLLEQLKASGQIELTVAEQQLEALEDGFDAANNRLDQVVENARRQIDALVGIQTTTLTISEAVAQFNIRLGELSAAIQAQAAAQQAAAQQAAAAAAAAARSIDSVSSPAAAAAAGFITSPVNSNGSFTGVGDSGYRLQQTATGATLLFPGGGSHSVQGPNAADLLRSTYGLQVGGLQGTLVRTRALGGYTPPGLTLVGEEGPELINFAQPGMVYTAGQTERILAGGNTELLREIQRLREEVTMLRAESLATARATTKTAKVLERVIPDGDALAVRSAS